jgi:hypothetical protein
MPLSKRYRFIYIHIPKCAGSSIEFALKKADRNLCYHGRASSKQKEALGSSWLHHVTAERLKRTLPTEDWRLFFKFTFVRNPWDLMVSFYHFHKRRAVPPRFRELLSEKWSFKNIPRQLFRYVKLKVQYHNFSKERPHIVKRFEMISSFEEWVRAGIYARPCSAFITDCGGSLMMDFVGRFENLERDFQQVSERIGIKMALPHIMKSDRGDYRRYYSPETQALVREHFRTDIDRFDYRF